MNSDELLSLLNKAGKDELIALPGVGPVLAERILAARPFGSLDSIWGIKGIKQGLLDEIMSAPASQPKNKGAPHTPPENEASPLSQVEDFKDALVDKSKAAQKVIGEGLADIQENLREGVSGLGETLGKSSQAAYKAMGALPGKFEQASQSHGTFWTILVSSAVTALVTILLTLLLLTAINGSLKFATGSQYRTMQADVSELSTQVNSFQKDLTDLRTRVNTLEGLGERTIALEKNQQQLSAGFEKASQQVTAMQTQVTALNLKVTQQEERTQRFESFLKDLQALLSKLLTP